MANKTCNGYCQGFSGINIPEPNGKYYCDICGLPIRPQPKRKRANQSDILKEYGKTNTR